MRDSRNSRRDARQFQNSYQSLYPGKQVKTVTFIVTHQCNLRCTYCYETHKSDKKMTLETAKKCVDLLFAEDARNSELVNDVDAHGLIIEFIGGEPFLEIDLIEATMAYFLDRAIALDHRWQTQYMINISTNGTLGDDPRVQRFMKKYAGRLSIGVTIDGAKEAHDACRVDLSGNGSYDRAIKMFRQTGGPEGGRTTKYTIAPGNIHLFADAVRHLVLEEGVETLNCNCVYEEGWTLDHARELYRQLKETSDMLRDSGTNTYVSILDWEAGNPLVDLFEFEVVVAPELGVASSHGVGGFQQVVTEIAVAGFDELGVLGLEVTRLVLCPDKASVFGNGCLRVKTADVANLGNNTSGVDLADTGDGGKRVRDDLELLLNRFVQHFDLLFQCPHCGDRNGHCLVHRVVYSDRQTIGVFGRSLDGLCFRCRICEVAPGFINESGQFIQISVGQFIHRFKTLHDGDSGGAGVGNVLVLGHAGAFEEQVIGKVLLLPGQALHNVKSGSGKGLQRFVAVIVHVDLLADPAEAEVVGDHKGVHPVVLGQVWIGVLELPDLFGIEHMDLPLIPPQPTIFPEGAD